MTEKLTQPERTTISIEDQQRGIARLAEWKTQLAALAAAPFVGIDFAFDFLLKAKNFAAREGRT